MPALVDVRIRPRKDVGGDLTVDLGLGLSFGLPELVKLLACRVPDALVGMLPGLLGLEQGVLLLLLDLCRGFALGSLCLLALLLFDLELLGGFLACLEHHLLGERRLDDLVGILVLETAYAGSLAFHLV